MIGSSWLVPGSWRSSLGHSGVPSAAFFCFLRDLRQGLEVGRFAGLGTKSVSRSGGQRTTAELVDLRLVVLLMDYFELHTESWLHSSPERDINFRSPS